MNRSLRMAIIVLVVVFPLAAIVNLEVEAKRADAIIVARPSDGVDLPDGVGFKLTVVRTVHGKPVPGEVLNVVTKLRRHPGLSPSRRVNGECGLFLLRRTSSGWEALGSRNSPFFSSSRVALGNCEAAAPVHAEGSSAFEKSFAEIALAVLRAPTETATPSGLFDFAGGSDSPLVTRIMGELSRSDVVGLRVEGIAWRVRRGDSNALPELVRLAAEAAANGWQTCCFPTAVYDYVNPDRSGVLALGRLVLDPGIPDKYLRHGAAHALRNIHTSDAVPYLAEMLDSPDAKIRTQAVSGLTEHVMGVRSVPDGPEKHEALDEALNPGRRKAPLPAPREYLHMGLFRDADQEARVLTYWRGWWQVHKPDFPAPQQQ